MSISEKITWKDLVGFSDQQIDDLRFTAYFYICQGKYDIARKFFEALVSINVQNKEIKQNPYDYKTLGALYLELGYYKRALRYLDRAVELDPDDWSIEINRLNCYFSLNMIEKGLEHANDLKEKGIDKLSSAADAFIMAWGDNSEVV